MTDTYKLLFKLIRAGVLGEDFDSTEKFGSEILTIARKNGVLSLIAEVFKKCYDNGTFCVTGQEINSVVFEVSAQVMKYSQKQYAVSDVIKRLEAFGVPCVMMKGDILGVMYKKPDLRMSNDTDLFIEVKDEKKCLKFFKNEGAYIKKRTPSNNQSVIVHPTGGVFEIHISLDTKQVSEVWYDNMEFITEPYRRVMVAGKYEYTTLGYTDTAIQLALHFIKHFVGGIAHVRMLTDTILFFETYHSEINHEYFWKVINHLKFDKIVKSLFFIANKYFGFTNVECDEEYCEFAEKLISDIAQCCEYGYDKLEDDGGIYNEYSRKRYNTFMNGDYGKYKKKIVMYDAFELIFKNKYEMIKLYPVLEKHIVLLPFMYCHRAFKCVFNTVFKKKGDTVPKDEKLTELKNKRMKLIDEMDML